MTSFSNAGGQGMSKKKPTDIYLKVKSVAFVTIPDQPTEPMSGRILVKVFTPAGEDLIGLAFDNLHAVEGCMSALNRIRVDMTAQEKVHPALKGPVGDGVH
jgi:hypothetical protein